jgi:hypothetical protein
LTLQTLPPVELPEGGAGDSNSKKSWVDSMAGLLEYAWVRASDAPGDLVPYMEFFVLYLWWLEQT